MASAFNQCRGVEARSREILEPFIEQRAFNGRYVTTDKGRLAVALQKSCGDVLMNNKNGEVIGLELKAEAANQTGNLFLEVWSNRSRFTVGWMFTIDCDVLLYHFIENDELYVFNLLNLRAWAFCANAGKRPGRIWDFPHRKQSKYDQLNDTWGACVPIDVLRDEVGFKLFHPQAILSMGNAA